MTTEDKQFQGAVDRLRTALKRRDMVVFDACMGELLKLRNRQLRRDYVAAHGCAENVD